MTHHEDELMHDPRMNACKTFVGATPAAAAAAGDGRPRRFRTYKVSHGSDNVKIWEAARATTAAPRVFREMAISMPSGGVVEHFVDGGLGCNNPSQQAYMEIVDVLYPGRSNFNCFLSIGTGAAPTVASPTRTPLSALFPVGWIDVLKAATTNSSVIHETMLTYFGTNADTYYRFNTPGMESIGLEEWESSGRIRALTLQYLSGGEVGSKMAQAVQKLATRPRSLLLGMSRTMSDLQRHLSTHNETARPRDQNASECLQHPLGNALSNPLRPEKESGSIESGDKLPRM